MPPKFNVNAPEFTPTSPPHAPPPPPRPQHAPSFPRKRSRHHRHDRPGRRIKYQAAGLQPPPRQRKPRRDLVDFPRRYQVGSEHQHEHLQQDALDQQTQDEEEIHCAPPPTPPSKHPSATTHHSVEDIWQKRLHYQHPRAWTSVSGIGLGADWGKAVGEEYGGLRYTEPRPITSEEIMVDYVVERAYEKEEWICIPGEGE